MNSLHIQAEVLYFSQYLCSIGSFMATGMIKSWFSCQGEGLSFHASQKTWRGERDAFILKAGSYLCGDLNWLKERQLVAHLAAQWDSAPGLRGWPDGAVGFLQPGLLSFKKERSAAATSEQDFSPRDTFEVRPYLRVLVACLLRSKVILWGVRSFVESETFWMMLTFWQTLQALFEDWRLYFRVNKGRIGLDSRFGLNA